MLENWSIGAQLQLLFFGRLLRLDLYAMLQSYAMLYVTDTDMLTQLVYLATDL